MGGGGRGRGGASQPELATSTPWQAAESYAKQAAPCIWIRRPRAAAAADASCSHRRGLEIPPRPGCSSSSFVGKEAFCLLGRVAGLLALHRKHPIRAPIVAVRIVLRA